MSLLRRDKIDGRRVEQVDGSPSTGRLGGRHSVAQQAFRFLVMTGGSAMMSLGIPVLLHGVLGMSAELAVAIAFVITFFANFVLLRMFVFETRGRLLIDLGNFAASSVVFRSVEYVMFLTLYRMAGIHYFVALGSSLVLSAVIKFLWYRRTIHRGADQPGS